MQDNVKPHFIQLVLLYALSVQMTSKFVHSAAISSFFYLLQHSTGSTGEKA